MQPRPALVSLLIFAAFVLLPVAGAADEREDFFERRIRPILSESCFQCHGDVKLSGKLRVDSRDALLQGGESGAAIVPGNPEESLLIQAIEHRPDVSAMPPDKDQTLRPDQVADFREWIRTGAWWPEKVQKFETRLHWAFQPIGTPKVPAVENEAWCRTAVDHFVLSEMERNSLTPATQADRRTLIRRATFDLTGLPPSHAEVTAFLEDSSPDAFEKVVDRLLNSSAYGEKWGRHWLDVVRYADTAGETADYPVPAAWRYRNYVIDSFNADKPYDQFLKEQIAGDILARQGAPEKYAEQVIATGFLAISRRFGFDSENYHHLTIQDTIDTVGQAVLGLSLGCARCHDHKFDPISAQDYYAMYGIFDSSRYAFPGSEQKQRVRSLAPLEPPAVSDQKWRDFDNRVAMLSKELAGLNRGVPSATLRSLNDMDGDFELQAPAAGGSNGVLVPPWIYEGPIAVTTDAQSPYRNVYAGGRVGAAIAAAEAPYRITQAVYLPSRESVRSGTLCFNLDFRIGAEAASAGGYHKVSLSSGSAATVLELRIRSGELSIQTSAGASTIGKLTPGVWQNLQLTLSADSGTVSGMFGTPGAVASIPETSLHGSWDGQIQQVELASDSTERTQRPSIAFDNLAVRTLPFAEVTSEIPVSSEASSIASVESLTTQLQSLTGNDGDFELQLPDTPPSSPWNPGPNSVVRLQAASQSPLTNHYAPGTLGIHMPNRSEYDGFGLTLPQITPDAEGRLFLAFDFRCDDQAKGGMGSWRYYVGHGPGNSAAVELFINGDQFFRRSGDLRDAIASIRIGQWYHVQIVLNTRDRTYAGLLFENAVSTPFAGEVATGWDGTIDYSFIDSYGHIGGVRPALDADNFVYRNEQLQPTSNQQLADTENQQRRTQVLELRRQLTALQGRAEVAETELRELLASGPGDLAYAMAEGTPHDVRLQKRGEPDQPGDPVPRGFIKVLGQSKLPDDIHGSGRMELANWLTRPDHPLTARVMVNRIWQYHFGRGLVRTPNDFGVRGQKPTNPALLDFLATEFLRQGWSVKSMHRMILLSATWQQSSRSEGQPGNLALDSELYRGFSRRRMNAEEIRDSILAVTGELDQTPGQEHPFPSPVTWGFSQHGPFIAVYDHNKRSVYLMTQRLKRHPFLALFDGADPNSSTADRPGTTVPTQALFFLNDPLIHSTAAKWSVRLQQQAATDRERIRMAWNTALHRDPETAELDEALSFLEAYRAQTGSSSNSETQSDALAALLRTLIGSNEFLHVD
ncbi:MAG: PSD1 and planctomycete cytochrome C domain-containing protein [Planctomycetia bacterium]